MGKRSVIARDLRTPKYRSRRIPNKKKDSEGLRLTVLDKLVWFCAHCAEWDVDKHAGETCPHCGGIA